MNINIQRGDDMGFKLAILVCVERDTGAKLSAVVSQKWTTGKYGSGEVVQRHCGEI